MKISYIKILLNLIQQKCSKFGRKQKYKNIHYLKQIIYVLNSGISWNYLKGKLHYTTYYKKIRKWSRQHIFEDAHKIMLNKIYDNKVDTNTLKDKLFFMDSSDIMNKNGFQNIGRSYKYHFKNATRVNVLLDNNGIPLNLIIKSANTHDTKLTLETFDETSYKIIKNKIVIADGGYLSKKNKTYLKNKKIQFICPYKRKYKTKNNVTKRKTNTYYEKMLLKERYVNETFFSWLKNNKRLMIRYDRLTETFSSFLYLKILQIMEKKIKLLEQN
jgi:transposase